MRQVAFPLQQQLQPQPQPQTHPDPSLHEFASAPILALPVLRRSSIILPSHNDHVHANLSSSTSNSSTPAAETAALPSSTPDQPLQSPPLPHNDAASPSHTAKKPRAWALFRRSASTLASAFTTDRTATQPPRIASQAEFRRTFLRLNRHRLLRDDAGTSFRLHPIIMNGDCGFASIAKGINFARQHISPQTPHQPHHKHHHHQPHHHHQNHHHQNHHHHHHHKPSPQNPSSRRSHTRRRPISLARLWRRQSSSQTAHHKRTLHAKDIRNAMFHEIRKAKKTYLSDRHTLGALFSDHDFDRLERDVGTPGITGHWLGSVLGVLEHVIIAHAMNVNIFLYQFDLQRQCVRQFERATVSNADCDVFLFFTGPATGGHFDTLVKMPGEQVMFRA